MADNNNNNSPKGNNPAPNGKGVGGNGPRKSPSKSWLLYILYAIIIIPLGIFLLRPDSSSGPHPIGWAKLESILVKHDYSKIVIVNQEYAEVYIKNSAIKSDTSYNDLVGKNLLNQDISSSIFYRYDFVTFESFEKDLEKVEEQTGERIDLVPVKRTSLWRDMLVVFGPFLLLILFFVFMSRISQKQMGGGGGGIFGVGKSKAKVYDGKTPTNVTFKDVAGLAGAKEEVMEVVDFLKNPQRYTDLGGKIPKGVLLVGPPGTGKTLLAKAVAGEANVPFFSMSGSDFVEMFVGVGASRVRDLFEEAKKKAPCIIFIDEIDAVGRARGHAGLNNANDERENTLNQLLTEMDGFSSGTNVIVLAATNRADVLDKALLRAGRFDRQIYVELPDIEERKAIFEVHMRNLKLNLDKESPECVDRDFLAKQTPGFSGADIANVCNEAALCAARKGKKKIEKQDFLDAIDRIVGGLEKRTKVLTEHEKRTIAYHESGHASVSWLLRWANPLIKVTIVPRGKALGAAWYLPEERQITTYEQMFDEMTSLMAGRAAEEIVFGKISTGALNDIERATKMAQSLVVYYGMSPEVGNVSFYDSTGQSEYGFTKPFSEKTAEVIDKEVKRIVEEAYNRAKSIILEHREQLDELAGRLFELEVLFREDLERIYGPRQAEIEEKKQAEAQSDTQELAQSTESDDADNTTAPKPEEQ
ncbi:MAG: ATP-dependent zinc metalloprotease FtsH [Bacteroidales bacterium]|nr:ATP-dependent zinc metalloprotease FtsH [Bacteroidales bacterium]